MSWKATRAGRYAAATLLAFSAVSVAPVAAAGLPLPTPPVPVTTPVPLPTAVPTPMLVLPPAPPAPPLDGPGLVPGTSSLPVAAPEHPVYQPSPEERAALPDEPERVAYEQQQADTVTDLAAFDATLGGTAIGAGGGTGRFGWPVLVPAGRVPITQRYGCTDLAGEPYKAGCPAKRWHAGLDLGEAAGTPVFAADTGVAHLVRGDRGYGNHILLVHGNGYATLYAHLSSFGVTEGQLVRRGEMIGQVGSTGFSTGPHLHFEIRYLKDNIDPCAELKC